MLLLFHNFAVEEGGEGKGSFFIKVWTMVHPGLFSWIGAISASSLSSLAVGGSWLPFPVGLLPSLAGMLGTSSAV